MYALSPCFAFPGKQWKLIKMFTWIYFFPCLVKDPVLAIRLRTPLLFWFSPGVRPLLFSSSILAANKRALRIFNITKMVAKGLQHAVLNGQYWVFRYCSYSPYGTVPPKAALHGKQKTV